MFRTLLKSETHRVAVTHCELRYGGGEDQVAARKPRLVFVGEANRQVGARDFVPVQQR